MTYERLAYDDQDSTATMHTDCTACASQMGIPARTVSLEALGEVPPIEFEDFPHDIRKPVITVSEAAAHLAARLHLHLD